MILPTKAIKHRLDRLCNAWLPDLGCEMVTPTAKREAVAHLKGAHEMSERRACKVTDCDRMTARYLSFPKIPSGLDWHRRNGRLRSVSGAGFGPRTCFCTINSISHCGEEYLGLDCA